MKANRKFIIVMIVIILTYPVGRWVLWKTCGRLPPTSLIQLIASPSKHHKRVVSVQGYLMVERENHALYLHKEDAEFGNPANSVWIQLTDEMEANPEKFNEKHVRLTGSFSSKHLGHLHNHSGYIYNITQCRLSLSDDE